MKISPDRNAWAAGTELRKAVTTATDGPSRQIPLRHGVTFQRIGQALGERSRIRRCNFGLKFYMSVMSILWNVASPLKAFILSFYGLTGDDLVFSHNLNWTMEVDYLYAKALYDQSGVKLTSKEGEPVRFINMYLDFVVFNRADKWAPYLDDFQQDPYVGLFCRASLVPKGDKITAEMNDFCLKGGYYAGNNYLEQKTCRVNEVSEAVMCLKGINVLKLMNYEWQAGYNISDPFIQEGARLYQEAIFPDLDACLQRRELLVDKLGRDDALNQLTRELAANYSLDPTGFAGKKGLYAEYRFFDGFKDLSGKPSGVRYSKMSGSLPERTQPIESDHNALVAGRERLWYLVGTTPQQFRDQVVPFSYFAPYFFVGLQINLKAKSGRFVEKYAIKKTDTIGVCQNWELLPTSNKRYPDPVYLNSSPESSVLSAYSGRLFSPRILRDNNVTDPVEIVKARSRQVTHCLSRDGCVGLCAAPHTAVWLATFDRSGLCQERDVSQKLLNRQGFVDWRCFGEGTGNDTFTVTLIEPVTRSDNTTFTSHSISNVATAGAIVACTLGGRIPQAEDEPYPNVFFDLLQAGANTIITTTFSRGSEKLLVNVYSLGSLIGCSVFSFWVLQNLFRLTRTLRLAMTSGCCGQQGTAQLLDSMLTANLSTVAHGRNIQVSKFILWLNLATWYIGATDSNCTWWVDGVDLWTPGFQLKSSDSPYYKCKPGVFFSHLNSLVGVLRLLSVSYNFYSLTCQHLILRGATRYARPYLSPILAFGMVPTMLGSCMITGINHLRMQSGVLMGLHNQLFLQLLWIGYLFAYHALLQNHTVGRLYVDLLCKCRLCGKQKITHGSSAEALIGPYYLTLPEFVSAEETEWIPLSVALESPAFDLKRLDFATRKYAFKAKHYGNDGKEDKEGNEPDAIPQWVLDDDEYLFC